MITDIFNEVSALSTPIPLLRAEEWEDYIVSGEANTIRVKRKDTMERLVREKRPHCEKCEAHYREWKEWHCRVVER